MPQMSKHSGEGGGGILHEGEQLWIALSIISKSLAAAARRHTIQLLSVC